MHVHAPEEKAELRGFGQPDEVREFPKGRLELINIGGATIGRAIFEPGWRWATSVQPIAKTKSCEAPHFQYHVSGVLRVKMDDGTELECRPGDVSLAALGPRRLGGRRRAGGGDRLPGDGRLRQGDGRYRVSP